METLREEKGFTLIEVLISLGILSILFIGAINFFPQMGIMNKINEEKLQSINTSKELLVKWTTSEQVKKFLKDGQPVLEKNPATGIDYSFYQNYDEYHLFKSKKNDFDIEFKIYKTSAFNSISTHAHEISVRLLNKKGKNVSKSYGYVIVEEGVGED